MTGDLRGRGASCSLGRDVTDSALYSFLSIFSMLPLSSSIGQAGLAEMVVGSSM